MERAIVRMHFDDDTFKTFLLVPTTTAGDLVAQVQQKLKTDSPYYLHYSAPGVAERYIAPHEQAWPFYKQHGERCRYTFRLKAPAGAPPPTTAAAGGQTPARAAPPAPSAAGRASLPPTPAAAGQAPASLDSAGSVACNDFDALLNQLQFPGVGPATSGAAGAHPSGGFDPLGGLTLGMSAMGLGGAVAPPCGACGQPVADKLLVAFGMHWHKYHLACAICRRNFDENDVPVVEGSDGKAYCRTDWLDRFAPKCAQCTFPIQGDCTNALGKQWHPQCFVCKSCNNPFTGSFFEHEGFAYCEKHYYEEKGLICPECDRPIIGKCVRAKEKRYHPQHFVCSHCKTKLTNSYFFHDNKVFCKKCSIVFYG
ncbi:LIM domain containing protein [Acanthamoeba castellanii str. Neff]|uniref:LIM domain containing protein n=1 Tax=Acanthamoeba castellanii (strain ATCC 30010 / Neff) TaxID=1257118 RepID=L8GI34_ACACF|nr:LIM domain containing protein [Acanthamoeba castellanii str. Neff]ELR12423.1 LIM domain containing protein [Acanthamoeba castellanii str. Neff]